MSTSIPLFSERLKELRKEYGLNITQAAEYLNVSRKMYSRYETGYNVGTSTETQYAYPTADKLLEIAQKYNTTTDYLLGLHNYRYIFDDELLEYLLVYDHEEFKDFLKKLQIAANQEVSYKTKNPLIISSSRKKSITVKSINDYSLEEYHRNLVKMRRWLEEYGNSEFLMRAAIKNRIKLLSDPSSKAVDIFSENPQ